jgi:hypothetical protein
MFETVRNVFDKHCDILTSSLSEKEKARKLMNKIVNALSTKTEMGGPMVCMYLLGNPDHYTNHTYIPFFWYTFVLEAQKPWEKLNTSTCTEKVALVRTKSRIVGLSPVYDYIYRPSELKHLNLYEWTLRCQHQKYNKRTKKEKCKQDCSEDDESNHDTVADNVSSNASVHDSSDTEENDSDTEENKQSDAETLVEDKIPNRLLKNVYKFAKKHPLYDSHVVILKQLQPNVVVNFIGCILPRCDQGDREFYCLTMLTFFKPWRSGLDLKTENEMWDEAFNNHEFTKREKEIIGNFNIKYECLDARDDFRVQMKAESIPNELPLNCMDDTDDLDQIITNTDPYVNSTGEFPDEQDVQKLTQNELRCQREALEIRDVLRKIGWTEEKGNVVPCAEQRHNVSHCQVAPAAWKSILQTKKLEIAQNKIIMPSKSHPIDQVFKPNVVKVMDKAYLQKKYHTTKHNGCISTICNEYSLNDEQELAFKIIANHVVLPNSEPLKMYLGGMGGTGKTQVLKAVSKFFENRNESYRFVIVAPTGTAAALLSGSTYHSVFGINDMTSDAQSTKALTQVCTRLQGVDYIFMDEVSMLSCHDMYKISAQLCKVMNEPTIPYGGLNMLFAGDFAQLPPPIGGEIVSLYSHVVGVSGTKNKWQEEAIGRALWHQVTTVVILRQNMRQKHQSKDDDKLRKALENMRYKDCTLEDIQFLRTRISSQLPGRPSVTDLSLDSFLL